MVEVVAHALFDSTSSSSDSDDFEIFAQDADTEESDGPTDPELGRADYWTCIKCKNQKNNPMYRFCEKCYQVKNKKKLFTSNHLLLQTTTTHTSLTTHTTNISPLYFLLFYTACFINFVKFHIYNCFFCHFWFFKKWGKKWVANRRKKNTKI